jgi:NAD(P) transhydrogenase
MLSYDFVVIGSGPSGTHGAIQAAKAGMRVALIDKCELLGGVCTNTGTIPSKTMREAVLHLSGFRHRDIYGVSYRVKDRITMADLSLRTLSVMKAESEVTQSQLKRNGIDVIAGTASFVDPTHLRVVNSRGLQNIEAKNILIACGTQPSVSARVPVNGRTILNSDQIFGMSELPRTLIVVGGGVIGVEYASMFAVLDVRVILVEKRTRLLEFADAEIVEALSYHLRNARVTMRLGEEVQSVEDTDGGVVANLVSKKRIAAEALLYAVGRQGAVDGLNLSVAGLEADERGRIAVNEHFQTIHPHIYAAGDIIGFPSLASVSMEQGRLAAAHACKIPASSNPATYPYGIYAIPEISFIGKTEEQLTQEDVPYEVGLAFYRETARGQIRGDTTGRLKLLFHRETHEILGVHIIGDSASELLHIGQAVLVLKGKVEYFVDTVFNYPTLAECYKAAALNGLNRLSKLARS